MKNKISETFIVSKKWEDVTVDELEHSYDLVLPSFSLFMHDIRSAIEKMIAASSSYIMLVWHVGHPSWEQMYSDL